MRTNSPNVAVNAAVATHILETQPSIVAKNLDTTPSFIISLYDEFRLQIYCQNAEIQALSSATDSPYNGLLEILEEIRSDLVEKFLYYPTEAKIQFAIATALLQSDKLKGNIADR